MLIGELAEKTGFSRDTIRYYEKAGLIKVNKKSRRENNYKEYSDDVLERLLIIKRAKHLGFSLNEIKELIESWQTKALTKPERIEVFYRKIAKIESNINKLKEVKGFLEERVKQIEKE